MFVMIGLPQKKIIKKESLTVNILKTVYLNLDVDLEVI